MSKKTFITDEEITKMKKISPIAVPLNPSVQGWSGQKVREYMSKYIFDAQDGLISKINGKMSDVSTDIETLQQIVNSLNVDNYVTEDEAQEIKNEAMPYIGETPPDVTKTKIWFDTTPSEDYIDVEDLDEVVDEEPMEEQDYTEPLVFNEFFEPLSFSNSNSDELSFDNAEEPLSFGSDEENLTFEN